ncbi:2-isopropylmalate synthase [Undibacterium jejuense]|uniref:2-isopropylmalate synthase n=1 Tax=Undibacterium jejuense TaxID=1344949 RepID=A0A923KQA3_9BURK|nr:2-isopropylmalate synthase [Undibacterium jejuense]
MMLAQPSSKYRAFNPFATIQLSDRQWPSRQIEKAPIWMSTDLRDGNQALIEPMNAEKKMRFFKMLVNIGIKEIEVAFPSASDTDFEFVRQLITGNHIPDDVTIEVLTPAREDLIRRTIDAVQGAKRAIIHLYNPVSPAFRRIVFAKSCEEVKQIAIDGTQLIKTLTDARPETEWIFQYSPETFSMTELDVAKDICDTVTEIWQATPARKIIINLPSTVECTTPNIYADQIEWMHRHLAHRDATILSVHPHNDRGTAVAAAELAVMAGADRIEGCLFGNGERTGNVDLVTLALNLYTQGISPGLDFADIDAVRQCVEECNQIPVHPRHPYVGDLVHTAFSGSHQDAIKKGFAQQAPDGMWEVPYLPIDPRDIGRNYDAVIRVNSQSGKGGMTYLLEQEYGISMPRRMQIEFSHAVQQFADRSGLEVQASDLFQIFRQVFLTTDTGFAYHAHQVLEQRTSPSVPAHLSMRLELLFNGQSRVVQATGHGIHAASITAFVQQGIHIDPVEVTEHTFIDHQQQKQCQCVIEARINGDRQFGAGIAADAESAYIQALCSVVNRHLTNNEEALVA